MTTPEGAIAAARAAAAQMRAGGAYAEATPSTPGPPQVLGVRQKMFAWAVIEPDPGLVRSPRRLSGAPLTALKRLLVRLLVQYHAQLTGEQTRFNVLLLAHVEQLEARIADLESQLRDRRT